MKQGQVWIRESEPRKCAALPGAARALPGERSRSAGVRRHVTSYFRPQSSASKFSERAPGEGAVFQLRVRRSRPLLREPGNGCGDEHTHRVGIAFLVPERRNIEDCPRFVDPVVAALSGGVDGNGKRRPTPNRDPRADGTSTDIARLARAHRTLCRVLQPLYVSFRDGMAHPRGRIEWTLLTYPRITGGSATTPFLAHWARARPPTRLPPGR
jgi:hypothetical protein